MGRASAHRIKLGSGQLAADSRGQMFEPCTHLANDLPQITQLAYSLSSPTVHGVGVGLIQMMVIQSKALDLRGFSQEGALSEQTLKCV